MSVKAEKNNLTKEFKQKIKYYILEVLEVPPNKTLKMNYGTITTKQLKDMTITCLENSVLCQGQDFYVQ